MKTRQANVEWIGDLKDGGGQVSTESGAMEEVPFGFGSRFLDVPGSNPEELLAAAHSACFATHLGLLLAQNGTPAEFLTIDCKVDLKQIGEARVELSKSKIEVQATVSGLSGHMFDHIIAEAADDCPMSRALNIEILASGRLA